MNKLKALIKFNLKRTTMKKSFVVLTVIGPVLIISMAVLPGLITSRSVQSVTEAEIALYGGDDAVAEVIIAASPGFLRIQRSTDLETSRRQCLEGSLDGIIILPDNALNADSLSFYTTGGSNIVMTETVRNTLGRIILVLRAAEEGVDPALAARLTDLPGFDIVQLKRDGSDKAGQSFDQFIYTAIAFIMLLYMTTLIYSQMIGRSVVSEKTSKTVEVMLSSVRPSALMTGKIIGMGVAGILQYGIWIVVSLLLIKVIGPAFDLELPAIFSTDLLGYLVLFFLLAFFLYSGLYAAVGAMAEDEQSYGQMQIPFIIPLVLPMVLISVLVMNPDSNLTVFLSFFPLTAPMVMFVRVIASPPPAWQILICVLIELISITAVALGSGRIFRTAILRTGKSVSLKEGISFLAGRGD